MKEVKKIISEARVEFWKSACEQRDKWLTEIEYDMESLAVKNIQLQSKLDSQDAMYKELLSQFVEACHPVMNAACNLRQRDEERDEVEKAVKYLSKLQSAAIKVIKGE